MSQIDDDLSFVIQDTLKENRQALIFVNSKKRAEKTAEDIANMLSQERHPELSEQLLKVLPNPTKQCQKLSYCAKKGVAFHHAGLISAQRAAIEDAFRSGDLPFICCTPTLALGICMPAFRTIIRDLKRFSGRSMAWIPVMEYHQIAGRAGRPGKETEGQALIMLPSGADEEKIVDMYIKGQPEDILSKLAVEPILRIYLLSLISINFVNTIDAIYDFFSKTFWAHQFEDMDLMKQIIGKMLFELEQMEFIKSESFEVYQTTQLGKRVAELYLDPLSAYRFIQDLKHAHEQGKTDKSGFLFSICQSIEMRPLLRVKQHEFDKLGIMLEEYQENLFVEIDPYDDEHLWEQLESFKTTLLFEDWISETSEDKILEKFDVRPGELHYKITRADWLLYSVRELCRTLNIQSLLAHISKLRTQMKYGIKEELLPFVQIKGVGRVRARQLLQKGIKDMKALRGISVQKLAEIVGTKVGVSIKEQLGQEVNDAYVASAASASKETKKTKNKKSSQTTLDDF